MKLIEQISNVLDNCFAEYTPVELDTDIETIDDGICRRQFEFPYSLLVPESNCFETTGANCGFQRSVISSFDMMKLLRHNQTHG